MSVLYRPTQPRGVVGKMPLSREFSSRFGMAAELLAFFMAVQVMVDEPVIVLLVLTGPLVGFGGAPGIGPFIYTRFSGPLDLCC